MNTNFYKIKCFTNLHVGNGEVNYGVVDKEVEKDPITAYPTINPSGVKGSLRQHFEQINSDLTERLFGSIKPADDGTSTTITTPGNLKIMQANMLARPIRASKGPAAYYMATTKKALGNLRELSLTLTGKELFPTELLDELQEECDYRLLSKDEEIALEDYKISNKPQSYELKNALNGGKLIDGDLVILSDSVFRKIPLPVVARNNLDESKRNLWYEEFVPHETVFWFAVMGSDDDLQTLYETINGKVIQFGGNASIGYGQCLVSRLEG